MTLVYDDDADQMTYLFIRAIRHLKEASQTDGKG